MLKITRTHWPLQVAQWALGRLRRDYEAQITHAWDADLSVKLDALLVADEALQSFTGMDHDDHRDAA